MALLQRFAGTEKKWSALMRCCSYRTFWWNCWGFSCILTHLTHLSFNFTKSMNIRSFLLLFFLTFTNIFSFIAPFPVGCIFSWLYIPSALQTYAEWPSLDLPLRLPLWSWRPNLRMIWWRFILSTLCNVSFTTLPLHIIHHFFFGIFWELLIYKS